MILTDIRNYLSKVKKTSLLNLCAHFNVEKSQMLPMIDFFIKKGQLKEMGIKCKDCPSLCNKENCNVFYEWL